MRCLVLGANGQDGSYLVEELIRDGAEVLGIGRQAEFLWEAGEGQFKYVSADLRDQSRLAEIVAGYRPDEVYHVAAVHGAAGFQYEQRWADALDVNVKALHTVLEYARHASHSVGVFYASSAKVFGRELSGKISSQCRTGGHCLYSITKVAAEEMAHVYARDHGVQTSVGYLFNHESPRRGKEYFIPRLVNAIAAAIKGKERPSPLFTLDFYCDWSWAEDVVRRVIDQQRKAPGSHLIHASGSTVYARDVANQLCSAYKLDTSEVLQESRPDAGGLPYEVDICDTDAALGSYPFRPILALCKSMIDQALVEPDWQVG